MENNPNELRARRMEMFEKMGVKSAGQVMGESAVATGAQNLNILQKIQQIKSGAAKSELNKYVSASSKSSGSAVPGLAGFDPIPEHKPKKNPNIPQQQVNPEYKIALDDFGGSVNSRVDNSELAMIDSMFGGGGSRPAMNPYGNSFDNGQSFMQQRPMDMNLDLGSTLNGMPTFNPQHALQRAQAKAQNNTFLQFAQQNPAGVPEDYMNQTAVAAQAQSMGITPAMKMMMESIAKAMAEQTIKKVLTEFTENQKSKNYFEVYNREKSIIKTADGKLYKLTPVQIKKG